MPSILDISKYVERYTKTNLEDILSMDSVLLSSCFPRNNREEIIDVIYGGNCKGCWGCRGCQACHSCRSCKCKSSYHLYKNLKNKIEK
jgi:hypothetical protein